MHDQHLNKDAHANDNDEFTLTPTCTNVNYAALDDVLCEIELEKKTSDIRDMLAASGRMGD